MEPLGQRREQRAQRREIDGTLVRKGKKGAVRDGTLLQSMEERCSERYYRRRKRDGT